MNIAHHIHALPMDYQVILLVELFRTGLITKDIHWYKDWLQMPGSANLVRVIAGLVERKVL